jgi:hypothetical protein
MTEGCVQDLQQEKTDMEFLVKRVKPRTYVRLFDETVVELGVVGGEYLAVFARLAVEMNVWNRIHGDNSVVMDLCGVHSRATWAKYKKVLCNLDNPFMLELKDESGNPYFFISPYDALKCDFKKVELLQNSWHREFDKIIGKPMRGD